MKKQMILGCTVLVLGLSGCQSEAKEESAVTIETVQESKTEQIITEENSAEPGQETSIEETSALETEAVDSNKVKEDRSQITREEWISRILKEEEARRDMPELSGTDEIMRYIGKTGGKAYSGVYNGDTYYLYLSAAYDAYALEYPFEEHGKIEPKVTIIKKKDTPIKTKNFGGRGNEYRTDEDELFFEIGSTYEYTYVNDPDYDPIKMPREMTNTIKGDNGRIQFLNGKELIYSFPKPDRELTSDEREEIHFTLMSPEEGKYWYSQNALEGNWNDFMYYEGGYYDGYYVRVEFTNGLNMKSTNGEYYMTVMSSVEDLDTYNKDQFQVMTEYYSYDDFSRLEDDKFMLEFISDRQAVLTNKSTGASALVRYPQGYLTDLEIMRDSEFYFYEKRIDEKDYTSDDGTIIRFSPGFDTLIQEEDFTRTGERIVDVYYQGDRSILSVPAQVVNGNTIKIKEISTNTELTLTWSDDDHFTVQGTGEYVPDLDGRVFEHSENIIYTN